MKTTRPGATRLLFIIIICTAVFTATHCGHSPPPRLNGYSFEIGEKAAAVAITMVGEPYRYGGNNPEKGFDCSGLVQYSYAVAGMKLPHSTRLLKRHTRPLPRRSMRKGDLVFFLQEGKRYSHVGIYVGKNRFVHAPSTGKMIRMDSLNSRYWKKYFLSGRRF